MICMEVPNDGGSIMASRTASVLRKVIRSVADADKSGVTDQELLRRFVADGLANMGG
jgi:hypothetical protein